jgi:hypothetical protein
MTAPARERDVAEAEQLLAAAQQRGSIPLPQLTDVDLCVFSDAFSTVLDADVWQRWLALGEDERDGLAAQALGFLEFRRLLRRADPTDGADKPEFDIQPKLGLILAARQRPAFVGVCSVPGQLRVGDLRLFGLVDEVHPDPVVLLERSTERGLGAFGRIRQYALATPDAAAGVAVDWVRESVESDPGAGDAPRLIELYRHEEGQSLTGERLSLSSVDSGLLLTHARGADVVCADHPVDQHDLASDVTARLRADRG